MPVRRSEDCGTPAADNPKQVSLLDCLHESTEVFPQGKSTENKNVDSGANHTIYPDSRGAEVFDGS